jgi:nitroreductase
MRVTEAIQKRRAYRSLTRTQITIDLVNDLSTHAGLSPSCFNNQPWRFVFIYEKDALEGLYPHISKGNKWVQLASMIIAVFSKPEDDCQIRGRDYYLFDTGMATAFLMLRATELGLVAHPIAGYREKEIKKVLGIPEELQLITLVNVGAHSESIHPYLSEQQATWEKKRPERTPLENFVHHNHYEDNKQ